MQILGRRLLSNGQRSWGLGDEPRETQPRPGLEDSPLEGQPANETKMQSQRGRKGTSGCDAAQGEAGCLKKEGGASRSEHHREDTVGRNYRVCCTGDVDATVGLKEAEWQRNSGWRGLGSGG